MEFCGSNGVRGISVSDDANIATPRAYGAIYGYVTSHFSLQRSN